MPSCPGLASTPVRTFHKSAWHDMWSKLAKRQGVLKQTPVSRVSGMVVTTSMDSTSKLT